MCQASYGVIGINHAMGYSCSNLEVGYAYPVLQTEDKLRRRLRHWNLSLWSWKHVAKNAFFNVAQASGLSHKRDACATFYASGRKAVNFGGLAATAPDEFFQFYQGGIFFLK